LESIFAFPSGRCLVPTGVPVLEWERIRGPFLRAGPTPGHRNGRVAVELANI